jgi:hypothetical protein
MALPGPRLRVIFDAEMTRCKWVASPLARERGRVRDQGVPTQLLDKSNPSPQSSPLGKGRGDKSILRELILILDRLADDFISSEAPAKPARDCA